jgi:hypothetical protein
MSAKKIRAGDKAAQQQTAEELQRQIDDILTGQPTEPPHNLRDFINEKMAEDARHKIKKSPAKPAEKKRKSK